MNIDKSDQTNQIQAITNKPQSNVYYSYMIFICGLLEECIGKNM
jgi:hypothetical protein